MNKVLPFLFVLLFCGSSLPGQPFKLPKPIEVQVMLLDNLKELTLPPYCGKYKTGMVLKYKVVKVISGFYLGNTIFISQDCVREAIENHTLSNHITYIYKLKLIAPAIEGSPDTYGIVL